MISLPFSRKIHSILKLLSLIRVIPYHYNDNTKKLEILPAVQCAYFYFCTALMGFYTGFLIVRVIVSAKFFVENFGELCILMFRLLFILDQFLFRLNFWQKRREIVWLFNQVQDINDSLKQETRTKLSKLELIMSTWPQGHFAMFSSTLFSFVLTPLNLQYLYSMLPEDYHGSGNMMLFFFFEALTWWNTMATELGELFIQTFALRSFIGWTKRGMKVHTSPGEIRETVTTYRETDILLKTFTYCFGSHIEMFKTTIIMALVFINFALLKKHDELNFFNLTMLGSSCLVGHFLPPLMYNDGFKVHTYSMEIIKDLYFSLVQRQSALFRLSGKSLRLMIRSMRPLQVKIMGLYFLDRTMTPLYYMIITNYTVTFLLTFSKRA